MWEATIAASHIVLLKQDYRLIKTWLDCPALSLAANSDLNTDQH